MARGSAWEALFQKGFETIETVHIDISTNVLILEGGNILLGCLMAFEFSHGIVSFVKYLASKMFSL
jgi:hypothetical protein